MRYAIFTDIHANLEALEAVLAKIDELALQESVDQIWFLGDLVGYGPNPNECIEKLRERTDVIIAGNHDWAAVGKIDIEDFSEAARISAEWTAEQLTAENRRFLANLPETLEIDECLLVHGSPYGPLWEYLTSEVLAERSFQQFANRFCFVGHTHVPTIFQQPDPVANSPTLPLDTQSETVPISPDENIEDDLDEQASGNNGMSPNKADETRLASDDEDSFDEDNFDDQETTQIAAIRPTVQTAKAANQPESVHVEAGSLQDIVADATDVLAEIKQHIADDLHGSENAGTGEDDEDGDTSEEPAEELSIETEEQDTEDEDDIEIAREITPEETILSAEERLNEEIEELLSLLGLSQSMITVTNEMMIPPEGEWQVPDGYRAIINPGGVGQPRDGDSRAAFMIYDTECGFTFYRVPYTIEKTQEKIIKAQLPQYLATRLAYGR
jgi:diadenosine tetraphosphatase ApaH/serine/threonine PP2A family protein phosphatase